MSETESKTADCAKPCGCGCGGCGSSKESQSEEERIGRELDAYADESGEPLMKMDGFDDCIAGIVERFGQPPIVCYDTEKVLAKLQSQGMSAEDAEEFFSYNQIGAWAGDRTPCFLLRIFDPPAPGK